MAEKIIIEIVFPFIMGVYEWQVYIVFLTGYFMVMIAGI